MSLCVLPCKFLKDAGFTLHTGADKEKAYLEVFLGDDSKDEDIFVKQYGPKTTTPTNTSLFHCWDTMVLPKGEGLANDVGAALQPVWEIMRKYFFLLLVLFFFGSLNATPKHSKNTKYPSYKGLIMAGYQGWFRQPKDGLMYPDENSVRIDMWPDIKEYSKTYPTGLKQADGTVARFFSSTDESTVDLHFKWMKDYGLDGVFMQRFFDAARPEARKHSTVLRHDHILLPEAGKPNACYPIPIN